MTTVAEHLVRHGGAALAIDYGYAGSAAGDTLQAVRDHRFDDPLAAPGQADLTAHVDFSALAKAAEATGAKPRPLWTQGAFLQRMGIEARAGILAGGKDEAARMTIRLAVDRLTGDDAMGALFKVLAISDPGLMLPLFDGDAP
jgi:NADH dehydrogenase [ubiquinone] 1 alpha subcomplex assembly factor 7